MCSKRSTPFPKIPVGSSLMDDAAWLWFLLLAAGVCYVAVTVSTWPYARPILPWPALFVAILFPPLFFFLLVYLLFLWASTPVVVLPVDTVVVPKATLARTARPVRVHHATLHHGRRRA